MRVLVVNHVSLDGVMQSPGRPDEDTRGGFRHGGWAGAAHDPVVQETVSERMGEGFSWLFGRRSYEEMLQHWNEEGGPFKDGLNNATKYVASSNADTALLWPHSTLLTGDVPAEVAKLRERPGGNLVVMGSGQLFRSLLARGQVDELLLVVHPLVLGSGHTLFGPDDEPRQLQLVGSTQGESGLLLATYRPSSPRVA
jgi:dihydrofolate reductase